MSVRGPAAVDVEVAQITVHVAGAVRRPGLVELGAPSRVADAVAAAGGATTAADLTALNLAAPVRDGDQIVVPVRGDPAALGPLNGTAAAGRIRINAATASQLEEIPGVGPVLAARIITHREEFGPFATVEDLLDVPGIGEAKLAAMRDSVQVP